jgi:hypothetical protein
LKVKAFTPKHRQALLDEVKRIELKDLLDYRPSEIKRRGLNIDEVRKLVNQPATSTFQRWARQTSRGRKRSLKSEITQIAMLAVQFINQDGLTIARGITKSFHVFNEAKHGERLPIHSKSRKEIRAEVERRLRNTEKVFIYPA